jgi:hypothetical protein
VSLKVDGSAFLWGGNECGGMADFDLLGNNLLGLHETDGKMNFGVPL